MLLGATLDVFQNPLADHELGEQPVSELFDWIRQAVPPEAPGTLSKEDTAPVVAYILKQNKMPAGTQALPSESEELRRVQMTAVKP